MKEDETKLIEHYAGWMCEKCTRDVPDNQWEKCPGCKRKIIAKVALDDGVVW